MIALLLAAAQETVTLRVGGRELAAVLVTREADRPGAPARAVAERTARLVVYPRPRHAYVEYFGPRAYPTVAFLDDGGAVVDSAPLPRNAVGATSQVPVRYALILPGAWPSGADPWVGLPDGLDRVEAEEMPTLGFGDRGRLPVELALDDAEWTRGLSHRRLLDPDEGMLFVFGEDRALEVTMRETYIPLDVAFLAADGRVLEVFYGLRPRAWRFYRSTVRARHMLEVNAGWFARWGLRAGDRFALPPGLAPRR